MSVEAVVSTIADGNMHYVLEAAAGQKDGDADLCLAKFGWSQVLILSYVPGYSPLRRTLVMAQVARWTLVL